MTVARESFRGPGGRGGGGQVAVVRWRWSFAPDCATGSWIGSVVLMMCLRCAEGVPREALTLAAKCPASRR